MSLKIPTLGKASSNSVVRGVDQYSSTEVLYEEVECKIEA